MNSQDVLHADLAELLTILGMGDHARPQSPHEVFQEALGVLRERLSHVPQSRPMLENLKEAVASVIDPEASSCGNADYYGPIKSKAYASARLRTALKTSEIILAGPIATALSEARAEGRRQGLEEAAAAIQKRNDQEEEDCYGPEFYTGLCVAIGLVEDLATAPAQARIPLMAVPYRAESIDGTKNYHLFQGSERVGSLLAPHPGLISDYWTIAFTATRGKVLEFESHEAALAHIGLTPVETQKPETGGSL